MRALGFSLAAALGAMIGALLALILKVGANTTCLDVVQIPVSVRLVRCSIRRSLGGGSRRSSRGTSGGGRNSEDPPTRGRCRHQLSLPPQSAASWNGC
jgi:hypothetical protein